MATVEVKPAAMWSLVKSWVGWLVDQLVWIASIGVAVAFFVAVANEYGFQIPFVSVAGGFQTWIYAAGILYLIKR